MNTFIIPVNESVVAFDQQVELDGRIFELIFKWNKRDSHWNMSIGRNGSLLISSIKLVIIPDLLAQHRRIAGIPEGVLFIDDLDGMDTDPNDMNFGDRVVLKYTEVA